MRWLREVGKAIPGLLLALFIGAASVAPRDAASNLAEWAQRVGIHNLSSVVTHGTFDRRTQVAAAVILLVYFVLVWEIPVSVSTLGTWGRRIFGRAIPRDATPISYEALADEDLKKQVPKWLAHKLSQRRLHVRSVVLFGSITHEHFATSDVDVIVCFDEMRDGQIAASVRHIRGTISEEFARTFGHKLHVTFFCANETNDHANFLAKQANPKVIYDRRLSASFSSGVR